MPDGWWTIETVESFEGLAPSLVSLDPLITFSEGDQLDSELSRLPAAIESTVGWPTIQAEIDRLKTQRPNDLAALLFSHSLATLGSPSPSLNGVLRGVFDELRKSADNSDLFPSSEMYIVRVNPTIARRYALVRVLLQQQDDPLFFHNRPAQSPSGETFGSAQHLFSDTLFGFSAYVAPLFLSASPWVWAFGGTRYGGVVVFSLGQAVAGRLGESAEMLQLFLPKGGTQSGNPPAEINPAAIAATLRWWCERLNNLFSEISDPANFCDKSGAYQPQNQFEVLLGVEQIFRHVGSLLAHDRDQNARRVLFFSALDTLEGLGCTGFRDSVEVGEV